MKLLQVCRIVLSSAISPFYCATMGPAPPTSSKWKQSLRTKSNKLSPKRCPHASRRWKMRGPMSTHNANGRQLSYVEAIREALDQTMARNERVIVIGEGVPDPKAIFTSTAGLREKYGPQRIFDMPLAENGLTGACIGAAIAGMRPVMIHQRVDFALLSMDQLVNNAAKWHYMFNGKASVPLVVRMIVGRGWGQGPQHSQSLQAMFAQIPGI